MLLEQRLGANALEKSSPVGAFKTPLRSPRVHASVAKQLQAAGKAVVSAGISVQMLRYSDGAHVRTIGSQVSGNGKFCHPMGVAVVGVCEYGNHRVQVLE